MARGRGDGERGQASVEHAGIALVVAVVLAAAGVAADALGARSGIADGVRRQIGRAICIVGGGGATCAADREACLVQSDAQQRGSSVQISILRLGRTKGLVVERLSDGTFRVTAISDLEGGLALSDGAKFELGIGARHVTLGGELEAAVMAHLSGSDSWTLHSRREVDDLIAALQQLRPHRSPDERTDERGWSVTLGATLGGPGSAGASVTISARDSYGSRVERATGRRTIYVRPTRDMAAKVTMAALEGDAAAGAGELYGVTVDRAGVPVELTVMRTGSYGASLDLPDAAQPVAGLLGVRTPGVAREYAVETRLALTSDADRRLAATFIGQVVHPDVIHVGDPVEVSRALARRLDEAGIVNTRVYGLEEGGFSMGGRVGVHGVAVGGSIGIGQRRSARLLAAASRGPDGVWYGREDCLGAVQGRA